MCICHISIKHYLLTYLLTAIRAKFGQKLRAQEEPKSLPPRCLSWAPNMPNCFCGRGSAPDPAGGAYSAPPDPLAGLKGPTSKGRGRGGEKEGEGREGERERERRVKEGRRGEGDVAPPPFLNSWIRPCVASSVPPLLFSQFNHWL